MSDAHLPQLGVLIAEVMEPGEFTNMCSTDVSRVEIEALIKTNHRLNDEIRALLRQGYGIRCCGVCRWTWWFRRWWNNCRRDSSHISC